MSHTREMLDASPSAVPLGSDDVAAAIDACLSCLQACTSCADSDLAEPDVKSMSRCVALCVSSADVCDVTARFLSRPAQWEPLVVHGLLHACVRSCTDSADECAKHAHHHRHCAICEKVCRACAFACQALLDDDAFEQLEKLVGA